MVIIFAAERHNMTHTQVQKALASS
jgi:hypothetical protein